MVKKLVDINNQFFKGITIHEIYDLILKNKDRTIQNSTGKVKGKIVKIFIQDDCIYCNFKTYKGLVDKYDTIKFTASANSGRDGKVSLCSIDFNIADRKKEYYRALKIDKILNKCE